MKAHKRLMASVKAIESQRGKIKLFDWLRTQPGSTRRGYYRGNFTLPDYVTK